MAHEVTRRNAESLERLREVGSRLSEDDLRTQVDGAWTAAGLLAHIAFWDRFVEARWRDAQANGSDLPDPIDDRPLEWINDAALPQWIAVEPRAAVEECLAAGASANELLEALPDEVLDEVTRSGRPRLVDRSLHRGDHLSVIERTFPSGD
jgi:hypothetical protein